MAQALCVARLSWRQTDLTSLEPISLTSPLSITFGQTRLPFPSDSFLQATPAGEQALIEFVSNHTKSDGRVLDLFCGLGTFGLSLEKTKQLLFSDSDGLASETLELALKSTNRAEVEQRNLFKEPFTAQECNDFDTIIFDPPRNGAKAQAQEIANSNVPNVIAISCSPKSFVRDAKILMGSGYKLEVIQPVDQFLWSHHMELAAYFRK